MPGHKAPAVPNHEWSSQAKEAIDSVRVCGGRSIGQKERLPNIPVPNLSAKCQLGTSLAEQRLETCHEDNADFAKTPVFKDLGDRRNRE
jgi:hypothetical protein